MRLTIVHFGPPDENKEFYRHLVEYGIELTVIQPRRQILGSMSIHNNEILETKNEAQGYKLVLLDLVNIRNYNFGFHFWPLAKALKESKPDLIHVFNEYHCFPVYQIVVLRNIILRRIPIAIYAFQNIDYVTLNQGFKSLVSAVMSKFVLKNLSGVTAANAEALEIPLKYNAQLKTLRTFWPVAIERLSSQPKDAARHKLGLNPEDKLIGYVGRMVKEKGLEDIVQALGLLPKVKLLLVGDGEYLDELQKLVKSLGLIERVIYKSFVPFASLVDYYNSLDCLVLPSRTTPLWKEQFGRVLVEAMACGVPVVGSSSGAIPEVLQGYPRHRIFSEGNVPSLVRAIDAILKEQKQSTLDFNSCKRFSFATFAQEHIRFYKELIPFTSKEAK